MQTYTVDAVGVRSLSKILGVVGLLWGVVLALSLMLGGEVGGSPGLPVFLIAIGGGALYGVVGGAITAFVYNPAAEFVGGIELELSE